MTDADYIYKSFMKQNAHIESHPQQKAAVSEGKHDQGNDGTTQHEGLVDKLSNLCIGEWYQALQVRFDYPFRTSKGVNCDQAIPLQEGGHPKKGRRRSTHPIS